jgi:hypothetical protein
LGRALADAAGQNSITFAEKAGSTKTWKLTRVNGSGYKRILDKFNFADNLPEEYADTAVRYQDMWDTFRDIYTNINTEEPLEHVALRDKIRNWFSKTVKDDFKGATKKLPRNKPLLLASYLLTPYFHILQCHVHQMVKMREIYSFTGQSFEKCNHIHQRAHASGTNHIEDNRPVLQQNLRVLMNAAGSESHAQGRVLCGSAGCSASFSGQGAWTTHRRSDHSQEFPAELALETAQAYHVARLIAARPPSTAVVVMQASFIRDTNNAYEALKEDSRVKDRARYRDKSGAARTTQRNVNKSLRELQVLGETFDAENN